MFQRSSDLPFNVIPVVFHTSKHQGNVLEMTQVKVGGETRTQREGRQIEKTLKGYQAAALRD